MQCLNYDVVFQRIDACCNSSIRKLIILELQFTFVNIKYSSCVIQSSHMLFTFQSSNLELGFGYETEIAL